MNRSFHRAGIAAISLAVAASAGRAQSVASLTPPQVYERARASLVVIHYTWASELGPREVSAPGVVIDKSGVVMCNAVLVNDTVPLKQIQDVKVIVPRAGDEPLELAADFQGRDDRCGLAYFKVSAAHDWTPLTFTAKDAAPGDVVSSVGLLGQSSGYKPVIGQTMVSAVSAEGPQVSVDGRLAGVGAVVFDSVGEAIGYALPQMATMPGRGRSRQSPGAAPGFMPASAFVAELADRPTTASPIVAPWIGVADWNGMKADEAAYYDISSPAIRIGEVSPAGPLDRAGIKAGQIVVGFNGHPLQRGDDTDSTTAILAQQITRLKPGAVVRFDVVPAKGAKPRQVEVTLDSVPPSANTAERSWSEELGFGVRNLVYQDRFARRLPPGSTGVIVTLVRPSGPSDVAHLPTDALVKEVCGHPASDTAAFAAALQEHRQAKPSDPVILLVSQDGRDETVRIEPN